MGNVFYLILTGLEAFQNIEKRRGAKAVYKEIMKGNRSPISKTYTESDDPFTKALLKSIEMCWIQDPKERASASQVLKYINTELKEY
jgi:hypothetical protein